MAYQHSRIIQCQSHSCRRTAVILYLTHSWGGNTGIHTFPNSICLKVNVTDANYPMETVIQYIHEQLSLFCKVTSLNN